MILNKRIILIMVLLLLPLVCYATDTQLFQNFLGDASGQSPPHFLFGYELLEEIFDTLMHYAFFGMLFIPAILDEDDKKQFEVDIT